MQVRDAKVRWNEDVLNKPVLQILVNRIPDISELTFESKQDKSIWYAEKDGFVKFFSGHPDEDGKGFGGDSYTLNTKEGKVELVGPFSSRAGYMNNIGFGPCIDVELTTNKSKFKKHDRFTGYAVTKRFAEEAIQYVPEAKGLKSGTIKGEPIFYPYK